MDFWEAVVLIVAIVVIGRVMSGGRWNKETRRWEKNSPDNPYLRASATDEIPLLRKEIARLNERVQTLEKIAIALRVSFRTRSSGCAACRPHSAAQVIARTPNCCISEPLSFPPEVPFGGKLL